ncbi:VPLPA-CTERM sorting domain-containing protein [uncultured Roseobacter sp.]|uniref:VPLPA-CTERM sorting domain-containing protein n=1 Tax=uncultured Roseobacter sp. TaxID=114847 RepID=UPI00261E76E4|nr:VPLPA-CTERM sorting domain-containing protein [uncultured Roseobacter sp.]
MRNLFTLVFSAALGLTAAVGASSLGFGTFTVGDSVAGAQTASAQFKFNAENAEFGATGGDVNVQLAPFSDSTISFFEVNSIGKPFEFQSIDIFAEDGIDEDVKFVGFLDGAEVVSEVLNLLGGPVSFAPGSFVGKPIDQLRIGSVASFGGGSGGFGGAGGGGTAQRALVQLDFSEDQDGDAPVVLDNLELAELAAVPVPASILLFGTALAGFGVMRRRQKT